MAIKTLADIAGAGATVALTTDRSLIARGWVQFTVVGNDGRVGDSNVGASRGTPLTDHQGMFYPPITGFEDAYVLADLYAYLPVGATLSVAYQE